MKKKKAPAATLVFATVLACSCFAARAEVDPLVQQAREAMTQHQPQQAYDLLEPQEVSRAGDPDFDLAFGMAANAVAQYPRAIMALERVLAMQPDNAVARAELGRALLGVGDTRGARAALSQGKLEGVTFATGESLDQLLQAVDRVDAAARSSSKGYLEFGIGQDSNANSGPADRNFAVPAFGGSLVTLAPSSTKTRGNFVNVAGGFSGRHVLSDPRWSIIGNLTGAARRYDGDASQFDTLQVDGNIGAAYRVDRSEYTLVAQAGTYDIDNARVRNLAGLIGEWTFRLDGFRQLSTYAQLTRMWYPQQHVADVDRDVFGFTYAHLTRNGFLAYGGLYAGQERTRASGVPHLGHKLVGLRGGVQQALSYNVAMFATLGYEERRFGGPDPLFQATRHDEQTQVTAGFSWIVRPLWRLTPQVSWTRVDSTIALARYDRTVVSVVARRDF